MGGAHHGGQLVYGGVIRGVATAVDLNLLGRGNVRVSELKAIGRLSISNDDRVHTSDRVRCKLGVVALDTRQHVVRAPIGQAQLCLEGALLVDDTPGLIEPVHVLEDVVVGGVVGGVTSMVLERRGLLD